MINIVESMKEYPLEVDGGDWGEGHVWDLAVLSITTDIIGKAARKDVQGIDKQKLAACLLTQPRQDAWVAIWYPSASSETFTKAMVKEDVGMNPKTLRPEIFKEWYFPDISTITARGNYLGPMRRIDKIFCGKNVPPHVPWR